MEVSRTSGSARRRLFAASLTVMLCVVGCKQPDPVAPPPRPTNILFVSIDTLRADHTGVHGYSRDTTPILDELAREGVVFTEAFATASWTLPSHMSMMTSRYPHRHGVRTEADALPPSVSLLSEALSSAGYRTAGFVSWYYVAGRFGFDRGFEQYTELFPEGRNLHAAARGEEVVDRALEWLEQSDRPADEPFYLFVHLFDPHIEYNPLPPYDTLFDEDYAGTMDGRYGSIRRTFVGSTARSPTSPRATWNTWLRCTTARSAMPTPSWDASWVRCATAASWTTR
jgi:hypothetical protein